MNNTWKKDNSVAKGGSRAPDNHPFKDNQDYAHKNFVSPGNPSGHVKNTQIQSHAGPSKSQRK